MAVEIAGGCLTGQSGRPERKAPHPFGNLVIRALVSPRQKHQRSEILGNVPIPSPSPLRPPANHSPARSNAQRTAEGYERLPHWPRLSARNRLKCPLMATAFADGLATNSRLAMLLSHSALFHRYSRVPRIHRPFVQHLAAHTGKP